MNVNPWFVTGFCEAEGAFTYSRSGSTIQPKFSVRQRHDHTDLVRLIADFFRVGTVYECRARGRTMASTYYVVIRRKELPKIISHFEAYRLQSAQKMAAYEVWRNLVDLRGATPRSKLKTVNQKLSVLARKLSTLNTRPRGFTRHRGVIKPDGGTD